MNCVYCKINRISPTAVPFGGYICPEEHVQCHFCNNESQGLCLICKKRTVFLMMQCDPQPSKIEPNAQTIAINISESNNSSTATFTFSDKIIDDIENKSMISQEEISLHDIDDLDIGVSEMLPQKITDAGTAVANQMSDSHYVLEVEASRPNKLLQEHAQIETLFLSNNPEETAVSNYTLAMRVENGFFCVENLTQEALIGRRAMPIITYDMKPEEHLNTSFSFTGQDNLENRVGDGAAVEHFSTGANTFHTSEIRAMNTAENSQTAFAKEINLNKSQLGSDTEFASRVFQAQLLSEPITYGYVEHYVQNIESLPTMHMPCYNYPVKANSTERKVEKSVRFMNQFNSLDNSNQIMTSERALMEPIEDNILEVNNTTIYNQTQTVDRQQNSAMAAKQKVDSLNRDEPYFSNEQKIYEDYGINNLSNPQTAMYPQNFIKQIEIDNNEVLYINDKYEAPEKSFRQRNNFGFENDYEAPQCNESRTYKCKTSNPSNPQQKTRAGSLSCRSSDYKTKNCNRMNQQMDEAESMCKFKTAADSIVAKLERKKIDTEKLTDHNQHAHNLKKKTDKYFAEKQRKKDLDAYGNDNENLPNMKKIQFNLSPNEYMIMKANISSNLSDVNELSEFCGSKKDAQNIDIRMQKVMETIQENSRSVKIERQKPETSRIKKSPKPGKKSSTIKSIPVVLDKRSELEKKKKMKFTVVEKLEKKNISQNISEIDIAELLTYENKDSIMDLYQKFAQKYSKVHRAVYKPAKGPFVRLTNEHIMTTLPENQFELVSSFVGSLQELYNLKQYEVKLEKVLASCLFVSRMPLLCPETICKRLIFVSDFNNHLVYDHRTVIMERITPAAIKNFLLDPRLVHNGISRCHVMYLLQEKVCDVGSNNLKDTIPVLLMATRINLSKLYNWTKPAVAFSDPEKECRGGVEFRHEKELEFILIWLTGVVPEDIPISVHIAAWLNSGKTPICHTVYSGMMYSARKSHTPEDIWRSGEALAISTVDLIQLTNNESEMIHLQIFID